MQTSILATIAGVTPSQASNYKAGRGKFLTDEALSKLEKADKMPHAERIEWHFKHSGEPLTLAVALTKYGIGALSQRVREMNIRYQRNGDTRRIINTQTGRGIGKYAIYQMVNTEEK